MTVQPLAVLLAQGAGLLEIIGQCGERLLQRRVAERGITRQQPPDGSTERNEPGIRRATESQVERKRQEQLQIRAGDQLACSWIVGRASVAQTGGGLFLFFA